MARSSHQRGQQDRLQRTEHSQAVLRGAIGSTHSRLVISVQRTGRPMAMSKGVTAAPRLLVGTLDPQSAAILVRVFPN